MPRLVCRAADSIVGAQVRANTKSGAHTLDCVRGGLGACPQEIWRFFMLWSVFWELLRFLFEHAYRIYIPGSCRLFLAVSGLQLRNSHKVCIFEVCVISISLKQKSRLTWNQQYSEMDLLKKLDWDENNEPDLIWKSSALFGAPFTLGAWDKLPLLPLPVSGTVGMCRLPRHTNQVIYTHETELFTVFSPREITLEFWNNTKLL